MEENGTIITNNPLGDGKAEITYSNGFSYVGDVDTENRPNGKGRLSGKDQSYWEGDFVNGSFVKGEVNIKSEKNGFIYYYAGEYESGLYEGKGKLYVLKMGNGTNETLEGTFKGGQLEKGKMSITDPSDGSSYSGEAKKGMPHGFGKRTEENGTYSGIFEDGKKKDVFYSSKANGLTQRAIYDDTGKMILRQDLTIEPKLALDSREWNGEEPLASDKEISDLKPMHIWECGQGDAVPRFQDKYYSYGPDGNVEKVVGVCYDKINSLLSSGEGVTLDSLVDRELVMDLTGDSPRKFENFEEARQYIEKIQRDRFKIRTDKGDDGFSGGSDTEINLIALATLDDKSLKNIRFKTQKISLQDVVSLLESIGINSGNFRDIPENFISLAVETATKTHAICFTVDLGKLKKMEWNNINESKDILIFCQDSSGVTAGNGHEGDLGGVRGNCGIVKGGQQKSGSCWLHSVAAVLTMAKNPRLAEEIESGRIKLYKFPNGKEPVRNALPNNLTLAETSMVQEIADRFGASPGDGISMVRTVVSDGLQIYLKGEASSEERLLGKFDSRIKRLSGAFREKLAKSRNTALPEGDYDEIRGKVVAEQCRTEFQAKIRDISNRTSEVAGLEKNDDKDKPGYRKDDSAVQLSKVKKMRMLEEHSKTIKGLENLRALEKAVEGFEKRLEEESENFGKREAELQPALNSPPKAQEVVLGDTLNALRGLSTSGDQSGKSSESHSISSISSPVTPLVNEGGSKRALDQSTGTSSPLGV
ncbi:MAG: hypothetical protein LBU15_01160 [Rickettsiales bacterium]|jgi:hypothetical protein|nr:hypothetical protein [Rickettsiales bacterium]